jgi:DNA-binding beta-propeller fold protein YncE
VYTNSSHSGTAHSPLACPACPELLGATKSFTIRTSAKCAHNSFAIRISKFIGLKALQNPHIQKNPGVGGFWCFFPTRHSPLLYLTGQFPLPLLAFFHHAMQQFFDRFAAILTLHPMKRLHHFRVYFLLGVLLVAGIIVLLREHRPSFLRPGLRLNAYVSAADGSVTVVDLVRLAATTRIPVGPGLSGMREHPTRAEIWGLSSAGGYAWILNARADQITARIPVGPLPYALDFSADGSRVYTTSSGSDTLLAIDCQSHAILARAHTGAEPVLARVTPDGKSVLVVNRREASLGIHDAASLALRSSISVVAQPEDVAILPDSSVAFVLSRSERRMSVVDLRRGVLLTNLELAGRPSDMLLKGDGGELYVFSPESHGLQAINTWTHEVGDYVLLGSSPARGVLSSDSSQLYVSDTSAGRVTPVDIVNRRVSRPVPAGQSPVALRFAPVDPGEKPNLLLVVNQVSGDLAVIRTRTDSLVTMIPLGDRPQDIAVKLF